MNLKELQGIMAEAANDYSIFDQAKQYALDYMQTIQQRRVYPDAESIANLEQFDENLPELPGAPHEILDMLHTYGSLANRGTN